MVPVEPQVADQILRQDGRAALFDGHPPDVPLPQVGAQPFELEREPGFHLPNAGKRGFDAFLGGQVGDLLVNLRRPQTGHQRAHHPGADHRRVRLVEIAARLRDRQRGAARRRQRGDIIHHHVRAGEHGRPPLPGFERPKPEHGLFQFPAQGDELDFRIVPEQFAQIHARRDFHPDGGEIRAPVGDHVQRGDVAAHGGDPPPVGPPGRVEEQGHIGVRQTGERSHQIGLDEIGL